MVAADRRVFMLLFPAVQHGHRRFSLVPAGIDLPFRHVQSENAD